MKGLAHSITGDIFAAHKIAFVYIVGKSSVVIEQVVSSYH
jgi:hypothetical protein